MKYFKNLLEEYILLNEEIKININNFYKYMDTILENIKILSNIENRYKNVFVSKYDNNINKLYTIIKSFNVETIVKNYSSDEKTKKIAFDKLNKFIDYEILNSLNHNIISLISNIEKMKIQEKNENFKNTITKLYNTIITNYKQSFNTINNIIKEYNSIFNKNKPLIKFKKY